MVSTVLKSFITILIHGTRRDQTIGNALNETLVFQPKARFLTILALRIQQNLSLKIADTIQYSKKNTRFVDISGS